MAGGGSWLAHSTFQSGLWIDNEQRYRSLVSSDRLTLSAAFQRGRAGRPPASCRPPTGRGRRATSSAIDRVHDDPNLGYHGPNFSWSPMPDQYTLAQFQRLEHGRTDRGPLIGADRR